VFDGKKFNYPGRFQNSKLQIGSQIYHSYQSPSLRTNPFSTTQELLCILWNPKSNTAFTIFMLNHKLLATLSSPV